MTVRCPRADGLVGAGAAGSFPAACPHCGLPAPNRFVPAARG